VAAAVGGGGERRTVAAATVCERYEDRSIVFRRRRSVARDRPSFRRGQRHRRGLLHRFRRRSTLPEREPDVPDDRSDRRRVRRERDRGARPEMLSAGPDVRSGSAVLPCDGVRGSERVPTTAVAAAPVPGDDDDGRLRLRSAQVQQQRRAGRRGGWRSATAVGRGGGTVRLVVAGRLLLRLDRQRVGTRGPHVSAPRTVLSRPLHVRQQMLPGRQDDRQQVSSRVVAVFRSK